MSMITTIKGMNKKKLLMIIGLAVILVAAVFLVRESGIEFKNLTPSKIREYLLSFGMVKGALVYLAIYTFSIRPFVPIPPTLYTFAGGFTFGPIWGTVLTVTGATLNASLCFLIARALGKDFVEKISKGKFGKLNERLRDSGFKTLLLIRTSPVGPPFDLVSYASGVLRIPFWSHFVATMVGVIPAVAVYSYFGGSITKGGLTILIAFFLVVVISILVPWYIKRRNKQPQMQ
ncbi:MAG: associated Golgi family protein [Candidatus Dadabacteria bacterium]|nr:associated Golgi family protein [Candidatus Dadabacteria bacterium]